MNSISLLTPHGQSLAVAASGGGPVLMLLHGFPLNHRMWLPQLTGLSRHFHVIAPDFRGFGQSSLDERDYELADLADDVELVRTRLAVGNPLVLCGLSMGGYVAFEYWRRYGQHLAGLVLANTKPQADDEAARAARLKMAKEVSSGDAWSAIAPMLSKLLHQTEHSPVAADVEAIMRDSSRAAIAAAQRAMAQRADFMEHLTSLEVPTLVLTGEHDPIAPPAATRAWAETIPGAQVETIGGAAHLTPLETPEEFNQLVSHFVHSVVKKSLTQ